MRRRDSLERCVGNENIQRKMQRRTEGSNTLVSQHEIQKGASRAAQMIKEMGKELATEPKGRKWGE